MGQRPGELTRKKGKKKEKVNEKEKGEVKGKGKSKERSSPYKGSVKGKNKTYFAPGYWKGGQPQGNVKGKGRSLSPDRRWVPKAKAEAEVVSTEAMRVAAAYQS